MMKARRKWLFAAAAVFLVSVLSHFSAIGNSYVLDDFKLVINNVFITRWDNAAILVDPRYLLNPYPLTCGARPLTVLSLMLDYRCWGLNPFGYHLSNVLLHAANGIILFFAAFLVFRSLKSGDRGGRPERTRDRMPVLPQPLAAAAAVLRGVFRGGSASGNAAFASAILAALVFALHPLQSEAVNIISFRADLLATLFSLLSLLFFVAASDTGRWRALALYAAAGGCYVLALLSKEVSLTVPFAFVLYRLLRHRPTLSRQNLGIALSFAVVAVLFLAFFWGSRYEYRGQSMIFINIRDNVSPFSSTAAYVNTILRSFLHYARTLLLPVGLSVDYQLPVPAGVVNAGNFLALLLLGACAAPFAFSRDRWLKFGLGLAGAAYLPVSNVIPLLNTVNDRYMYLSMAGFSIVVSSIVCRLPGRAIGRFSLRAAAACILLCLLGAGTFQRNLAFRDIYTLNRDAMGVAPDNLRVRYNYAIALMLKNRFAEAVGDFEAVERLNPLYQRNNIWYLKGECYANMGDIEAAKYYFRQSYNLQPMKDVLLRYASLLVEEGDLGQATSLLAFGSRLYPSIIDRYAGMAARYGDMREYSRSLACIRKVMTLKPDYTNISAEVFLVQDRRERPRLMVNETGVPWRDPAR